MSRVIKGVSLGEFGPGDLQMLLLRLEYKQCGGLRITKMMWTGRSLVHSSPVCVCVCVLAALTYLKDLLFSVPSSTTSVLSRTASEGDDRRMRDVAGTPSRVLGDPSLRRSKRCLTGSYSMSSCSV